ncbi:MAG: hypothetical protein ACPGVO_03075 [Spirulinaceae cyanobacterium]
MPPSETFRDRLRAGQLQDAFLLAMGQAVELNVTTWVAAGADITATTGHRLQTHIDLVQGDIENEIGERFITQTDYQPLRQFHLQQVAESQRIIRQNLQSLQQLFTVLANVQGGEPASGQSSGSSNLGISPDPYASQPSSPSSATEPWRSPDSPSSTPTYSPETYSSEPFLTEAPTPAAPPLGGVSWGEEEPWPPEPPDPFADLPLDDLPLDDLQIADLQNLTPPESTSASTRTSAPIQEEPNGGAATAADVSDSPPGWSFSDIPAPSSSPPPRAVPSPPPRPTPNPPLPNLEEDEDWDEFVEFVEESSFEAETFDASLNNPFALPLEEDPQSYTSVIQEDWSTVPPSQPPDAPDANAQTSPAPDTDAPYRREDEPDLDPFGEDIFGSPP